MTKMVFVALAAVGAGAFAYSKRIQDKEQIVNASDAKPQANAATTPAAGGEDPEKVDWAKADWARRLSPSEFEILRHSGTERAFTGEYWDFFEEGQYNCRGCGLPLFKSDAKFDAHCGWPSFDRVIADNAVVELEDDSHGMHRIEVRCRRCNGHLGHVFNDGPTDTGLRYCMNSASIKFQPEKPKESEKPAADR
jgi:peptide-methionine (R)-S-oxide reductase